MVAVTPKLRSSKGHSRRYALSLSIIILLIALFYLFHAPSYDPSPVLRASSYDEVRQASVDPRFAALQAECRFFLAESAIPSSGWGIFTARNLPQGTIAQSMPDICIYVSDTPAGTHFETHSWAMDVFMGVFEGPNPRAACEGVATLVNTMPNDIKAAELVSMPIQTNGGLRRDSDAGAGAISHYYGITSQTVRDIEAGAEITINYGDWPYDPEKTYVKPVRTVPWLQQHGLCIDHIDIRNATDRRMGRGAFAKRHLYASATVAPAPLQVFKRHVFANTQPEALLVNYCLEAGPFLLYPYGPGVNLINHSPTPNVAWRWSTNALHRASWLDLSMDDFWKMDYPGALTLEVYALRDIAADEELFLDYGQAWSQAWQQHVGRWVPVDHASRYVYPADMDVSKPFLTIQEQETNPYPYNLATACFDNKFDYDYEENEPSNWTETKYWPEGLYYCHVLARQKDASRQYTYIVSMGFEFDEQHALNDTRYTNVNVPHSAIMFVDKTGESDQNLANGFRHPLALPANLVPKQWTLGSD